ncbi:MAG: hypothetical protein Q9N62_10625 [Ghiorsea sp.]|nr:hypothetical protein [Ghiorsea sp.]
MPNTSPLAAILKQCCETYSLDTCLVSADDGLLLAMAGEPLEDDLSSYIPKWLVHGEKISEYSGLGSMACGFIVPNNKSGIIAVQKIKQTEQHHIFIAVKMKRIPPNLINTLDNIAVQVNQII